MKVGIGAVLISPSGRIECFGFNVPEDLVDHWRTSCHKKTVINQAELWPAVLARSHWRNELRGQRLVHFIDNDAARDSLIKGYSPVIESGRLVGASWLLDAEFQVYSWFARVPSEANISDGPSRGEFKELVELGAVVVQCSMPKKWRPEHGECPLAGHI